MRGDLREVVGGPRHGAVVGQAHRRFDAKLDMALPRLDIVIKAVL
jgi:hypothetical protein